jgi:hypothetical protein
MGFGMGTVQHSGQCYIAPGVVPVERPADEFTETSEMTKVWKDKLPLRKLERVQDIAQRQRFR